MNGQRENFIAKIWDLRFIIIYCTSVGSMLGAMQRCLDDSKTLISPCNLDELLLWCLLCSSIKGVEKTNRGAS